MNNRLLIIYNGYTSPFGVAVPAFEGDAATRSIITGLVRKHWVKFDIEVMDKNDPNDARPTAIIAVGGSSPTQGGGAIVGGFRRQGIMNNGTVFALNLQNNPVWIAKSISHETGHLGGLHDQAEWMNDVMTNKYRQDGAIMGSYLSPDGVEPFWTTGRTPDGSPQDDMKTLMDTFGAASTAPIPLPPPAKDPNDCQIEITAPPTVQAGATFQATFTITNTGTNTWQPKDKTTNTGYALGSQKPQDNFVWGVHRLDLSAPVAPGDSVQFTGSFKAPTTPDDYVFAWDMVDELKAWFGKTVSRTIRVTTQNIGIPVVWNGVPGIWTPT